jgi:hypothetical protein
MKCQTRRCEAGKPRTFDQVLVQKHLVLSPSRLSMSIAGRTLQVIDGRETPIVEQVLHDKKIHLRRPEFACAGFGRLLERDLEAAEDLREEGRSLTMSLLAGVGEYKPMTYVMSDSRGHVVEVRGSEGRHGLQLGPRDVFSDETLVWGMASQQWFSRKTETYLVS